MACIPEKTTLVEQATFAVPDLTMKDLLSAIPPHCFKRSMLKSFLWVFYDFAVIGTVYKVSAVADSYVHPEFITLPSPLLYSAARFSIWSLYGFIVGLFATGLWIIAHECGHQAFSENKKVNNTVGWILHSALGVPYFSWRITHAKHHASNGHMLHDMVFIPRTRSELGLPPLNPETENIEGSKVTEKVKAELWEAIGDTPLGAFFTTASYMLVGWQLYLANNALGQPRSRESHLDPSSSHFAPHQRHLIIISNIGLGLWLAGVATWIYFAGFGEVFTLYIVPFLFRVNSWIICLTFLQHTDPLLPHYRAPHYTFPRGALVTMDRNLLGDCGLGWLGAHATHGISETHVLHHVSSKIPHYNAWEATYALRERLAQSGIHLVGAPGGWAEMYRVYRECKFVEDEGSVVFYKNAHGLAKVRPVFPEAEGSDSGVELGGKS